MAIRLEVPESLDKLVTEVLRRQGVPEVEPNELERTAGLAHDELQNYGVSDYLSLHLIDEDAMRDAGLLVDALHAIGSLARERGMTARVTLPGGLELRLEDTSAERLREVLAEQGLS